ncbi:ABC transporter permease [Arsenicibacter rosenii]|uniref:Macrolide ABC transporter permease n=1 Tax=Arsenicibacter rosenii TaxID=1750698 RepID=A0A1S2VM75_9BACT|nr:ABC transporter permease [Arsenicibacter rosenii]OIN59325.1 macrolide ABC transporter permease [Arsenicibacter rosenii]
MIRKITGAFLSALQNIRSRFFHTILSILGIVIGVAALVAILSLIDGLEKYAQEQLTKTTSIKAIMVATENTRLINDIRVAKPDYNYFNYDRFAAMTKSLKHPATGYIMTRESAELEVVDIHLPVGAMVRGTALPLPPPSTTFVAGRAFSEEELRSRKPVAFINQRLAEKLAPKNKPAEAIGKQIRYGNLLLTVIGVDNNDDFKAGQLCIPITLLDESALKTEMPQVIVEAGKVEDVPVLKKEIEAWITANMAHKMDDFSLYSNDQRVEQAAKGFLVFRVVMGMIVGISVLVGGIGVMNVLLISVNERTTEIGVRKALGAKRRDILWQFLSESITISTFGSLLGLGLGILISMAAIPILTMFVKVPFAVAYTWNTFIIIMIIAMVIGIVFGTYPAMRAARLDPVEAIRRE